MFGFVHTTLAPIISASFTIERPSPVEDSPAVGLADNFANFVNKFLSSSSSCDLHPEFLPM